MSGTWTNGMSRIRRSEGPAIGFRGAIARVACGLLVIGLAAGCSDQKGSEATPPATTEPATAPSTPEATSAAAPPTPDSDPAIVALAEKASTILKPLSASASNPQNDGTKAKVDLGCMLYYDKRLAKNHDVACNSRHKLDAFGVDNEPTSPGHKGARGDRNSPTVYNAALHIAQFLDGRAADVEAQAKGPVLNLPGATCVREEATAKR
jgi:cytochrome c peroxidase